MDFDFEEQLELLRGQEIDYLQALAQHDNSIVSPEARGLLDRAGLTKGSRNPAYGQLCRMLLRGKRELNVLARARMLGDFSYLPKDPAFSGLLEKAHEAPKRTLGDLIESHRKDKVANFAPSTQAAYEPVWRLLKSILGERRDLATIKREEGRQLFEAVESLPRGLGKLKVLSGLPILDAIEKGRNLGLPTVSPKTINGSYMSFISSIFSWAVREQWMDFNPVTGLTVIDPVSESDKRDPFTMEQLKTIFNASPWRPRDDNPKGKPLHFWGPLIALFHGLRRGEIAQLDVADVTTVEAVPVILVRPGGRKRLKTINARRMVPVHPELVRTGFLRYVNQRRKSGEEKLFCGQIIDGRGQWGDAFSDWFSRLIKEQKIEGRKLGLHSFRHNWQDRAREAGLHGTAIAQELAGRSKGGDSSNNYGSGSSTSLLAEAVEKVQYPDLDLSHLHVDD